MHTGSMAEQFTVLDLGSSLSGGVGSNPTAARWFLKLCGSNIVDSADPATLIQFLDFALAIDNLDLPSFATSAVSVPWKRPCCWD